MKKFPKWVFIIAGIFLLILCAVIGTCVAGKPGENSIEPVDPKAIYTQVARTVRASMTKTASVNDTPTSENTLAPEATPTVEVGTRANPVPFGIPHPVVFNNDIVFTLTITKTIRGQEAFNVIYSANMYNDPAPEGQEYILYYGIVNYLTSNNPDKILEISDSNFKSISNNQIIDYPWLVLPKPEFNLKLFQGGLGEGYFALLVYKDDPSPLISLGANIYDNANRIYFSIQ